MKSPSHRDRTSSPPGLTIEAWSKLLRMWPRGLKPLQNKRRPPQSSFMKQLRAGQIKSALNLGLKTKLNKSPQGIRTSESGKHFKPSLKLIRMRPRTASNQNHEQNCLKAASNAPERLKIIRNYTKHASNIWLAAKHLPKPQPAGQPFNQLPPNHSQPTKQQANLTRPTKQPTHRPTDQRPAASQPISPTCQPTNQPTSQPIRPTGGTRKHPENKRPAAFQNLSHFPLQKEVHNL